MVTLDWGYGFLVSGMAPEAMLCLPGEPKCEQTQQIWPPKPAKYWFSSV